MRTARLLAVLALAAALGTMTGCTGNGASPAGGQAVNGGGATATVAPAADTFPVTVKDDFGRTVTIDKRPGRIVSLAPADTEIVAALGLTPELVGVTTYDNYPPEVKKLPKVGDFMTPNLEAIAAAKPDVVLLTGGVQADVIKKLENLGAKVYVVDPTSIEKTEDAIASVGRILGASPRAAQVVAQMKAEVDAIAGKVAGTKPVTAFVEIAQNPLYTAGTDTLFADMIRIGGGTNVVKQPGFVGYSLEQLLKDDPAVYFATKGGNNQPADIAKRQGYGKLAAVKAGRIYILDDDLVSRPGPRITQGLREIAEGLHPEAFK